MRNKNLLFIIGIVAITMAPWENSFGRELSYIVTFVK
jgi:hypothetical protein